MTATVKEQAPECDGCDGERCVYVGSLCNPATRKDDQMTPSEIAALADVLHQYALEAEVNDCPEIAGDLDKAAATIRELEAGRAKWEAGDGLDGSVVHAIREVLNRANVPTMAFIDDHVALLVHQRDAAEAKLKLATEALEPIVDEFGSTIEQYNRNGPHWTSADGEMFDVGVVMDREPLISAADQALARIKEVG